MSTTGMWNQPSAVRERGVCHDYDIFFVILVVCVAFSVLFILFHTIITGSLRLCVYVGVGVYAITGIVDVIHCYKNASTA